MKYSKLAMLPFLVTAGYAGTVFTQPSGLAPGSQYQLAFVTRDLFQATSTNISDYNTAVTNEAALNTTLAAFDTANGVTWTVIGSTLTVNALTNAPSTGSVYTLDGVQIASSASALYSGSLLSALDIDENGNTFAGAGVWTGTVPNGNAAGGINDLGQTFAVNGLSNSTTGTWIDSSNSGPEADNNLALYALSSVITVPQASTVPEPATLILIPSGLLLLAGIHRRKLSVGA